jgi:sec-independent protein translocase protein TatA
MAVFGYEAVVIAIILVVIFIWGPSKLPEVARSIGRARKEFEEASRGLTSSSPLPRVETVGSDPLIDVASRLGIVTEGKTRSEISEEIVRAAQNKK